ncbi:hypothetical protein HYC85_025092 [Camellia sinensis]|uniref:Uncharacterized protein n=1 Tax=Camellia sinensis TaxID=4442 RepID=A0A7J7GE29_CAMSI|nr:hypothetical protein HYC85_025092 [Camellia sinensis]
MDTSNDLGYDVLHINIKEQKEKDIQICSMLSQKDLWFKKLQIMHTVKVLY